MQFYLQQNSIGNVKSFLSESPVYLRTYVNKNIQSLLQSPTKSESKENYLYETQIHINNVEKVLSELYIALASLPNKVLDLESKIVETLNILLNFCLCFELHCGDGSELLIRMTLKHAKAFLNSHFIQKDFEEISKFALLDIDINLNKLQVLMQYRDKLKLIAEVFKDRSGIGAERFCPADRNYYLDNITKHTHIGANRLLSELHQSILNKNEKMQKIDKALKDKDAVSTEAQTKISSKTANVKTIYHFLNHYIGHGVIQSLSISILEEIRNMIDAVDQEKNFFYADLRNRYIQQTLTFSSTSFIEDFKRAIFGKYISIFENDEPLFEPIEQTHRIQQDDDSRSDLTPDNESIAKEYIEALFGVYGEKIYKCRKIFLLLHKACNSALEIEEQNLFSRHQHYYDSFFQMLDLHTSEQFAVLEKIKNELKKILINEEEPTKEILNPLLTKGEAPFEIELSSLLQLMDFNRLIYNTTSQIFLNNPLNAIVKANQFTFLKPKKNFESFPYSFLCSVLKEEDEDNKDKSIKTTFYSDYIL